MRLPALTATAEAVRMTYGQKVGKVLKELIKRSPMTQAEVAERAGIDPTNLSRITNGSQELPMHRLPGLARVLGLKPWEILRMVDQGVTEPAQGDPRKAALQALVDALDPALLDDAFRRWPLVAEQRDTPYAGPPKEDSPHKKKTG